MLTREEILRLARARRLKPWQEEKRYVQALVLYALSEWPVIMKGGTYLWFFHGLNRFSDDLNFTQVGVLKEGPEDVSLSLELLGLRNRVKVLKEDRYTLTFRVDAWGPLSTSEKDLCRVRVDISRREEVLLKPLPVKLDEPSYGIPIVFLRGMDLREALAEKIRAAAVRGAARDLYDSWFLLRRGIPLDPDLLARKLEFYGIEDPKELCTELKAIERSWRSELEPVVFGHLPEFQDAYWEIATALNC